MKKKAVFLFTVVLIIVISCSKQQILSQPISVPSKNCECYALISDKYSGDSVFKWTDRLAPVPGEPDTLCGTRLLQYKLLKNEVIHVKYNCPPLWAMNPKTGKLDSFRLEYSVYVFGDDIKTHQPIIYK